ncbi:hypothetical protein SAPIO_CDS7566 [Scedosporium apiospermum]|uniref:Secreted protein n=1 Tax=Pseudallescheria apiosperma TaxID=563466 RepID=A0A084G274_PSEDA|nr:uncharacterized protein SAPIO_CDS7566 [Scedosporium apiospermum]KEZ41436.1 hypothetical protein SAPIO_CDS7566 [Scedosporium apiospermum]
MTLLRTALLSLCAAAATSAFSISSIAHSGPACPQGTTVTWNENPDNPVFYLEDFSASVGSGQTTSCELHLTIEDGTPNRSLVLNQVSVWGRLSLVADGAATFYTSGYWSATAATQVTKKVESSTRSSFNDNVAIDTNLGLASPCVGSSGSVGILNLSFRVVSEEGKVSFGPERVGSRSYAVSEHLDFSWARC